MAATSVTVGEVTGLVAQVGGLAILAGTLAALVAAAFRWYAAEEVPRGLAVLAGLSGVALYLNTTSALAQVISRQGGPTETQVALFNIVAFAVGAAGAEVGRRVGDRFETDVFLRREPAETADGVGRLGRALGRVVEVQLPPDIDDVVGYDPVEEQTKETLADQTFVFPRNLSVEELESRLVSRLQSDYGVGTVDVDLAADGTVEHLGVGRRAAGIGPTLPPATNAVAVQADPPFAASAGDLVQLWEIGPARRVLTGELRGVAGETVTLAIDAADTPTVDPQAEYRLVTLPVEDRPDREFASLLRAADETYTSVTVDAGSPLEGVPVVALAVSIVAVADQDGETTALPTRDTVVEAGAVLFAIGTPGRLRRLAVAATALPEGIESSRAAVQERRPGPTGPPDTEPETPSGQGAAATGPGEAMEATSPDPGREAVDGKGPGTEAADGSTEAGETASGDAAASADDNAEPTPPSSFDELASELGEERAADTSADHPSPGQRTADGADAATDEETGEGTDEGAGDGTDEGAATTAAAGGDSREDDLDELAFVDDEEAGGDLDDLGDLSVGSEVEADDDLGGFEDITFGEEAGDEEADEAQSEADREEEVSGADEDESGDGGSSGGAGSDEGNGSDRDSDDADSDDGESRDEGDGDEDDGGEDQGDDDDREESDGGGGGGTFSQLKAEFESGDADWADDISDSPGGDMRLDE